jgi:hypothetical protein
MPCAGPDWCDKTKQVPPNTDWTTGVAMLLRMMARSHSGLFKQGIFSNYIMEVVIILLKNLACIHLV